MNHELIDRNEHLLQASAIVLKNYLPEKQKVVILHKYLGKITCIYNKKDAAARLCTGSLFFCAVAKQKSWYELDSIDVISIPTNCSMDDIRFFHEIVLLCLKIVPSQIMVSELFDFLWYVFQKGDQLTQVGKQIVMLRLFLLFDLLPENKAMYRCALQDPYGIVPDSEQQLSEFLIICWKRFHQEQEG